MENLGSGTTLQIFASAAVFLKYKSFPTLLENSKIKVTKKDF